MNERLKALRSALGLSQAEFAERIQVSRGMLANLETGTRELRNIHVSQICTAFHVNEEWLKYGRGEMLADADMPILDNLQQYFGLTGVERTIVETFVRLPVEYRESVLHYLVELVHAIETGDGYGEFREAYIKAFPKSYVARNGVAGNAMKEVTNLIDESGDAPNESK